MFLYYVSIVYFSVALLIPLLLIPYTKVEEHFNVQAAHDVFSLLRGRMIPSEFDSRFFPGVVPRTYLFSGALSVFLYPSLVVYEQLSPHFIQNLTSTSSSSHNGRADLVVSLAIVRFFLGFVVMASVQGLGWAMPMKGSGRAKYAARSFLNFIVGSTFHVVFYGTRLLPNTFALATVTLAMALLISRHPLGGLSLLCATAATVRCDIAVLVACVSVIVVFVRREAPLMRSIGVCLFVVAVSAAISVAVDSPAWGTWPLWPELNVLLFNTAENHSSEWGVSPWPWYFIAAIPRAFLLLVPLVVISIVLERTARAYVLAAWGFIFLYSFLPHKEVRFIMPVFPVLAVPAACLCGRAWAATRGFSHVVLAIAAGTVILVQGGTVCAHLIASSGSYSGSQALNIVNNAILHTGATNAARGANHTVFLDDYACMNGVSRWMKLRPDAGTSVSYVRHPIAICSVADISKNVKKEESIVVNAEEGVADSELETNVETIKNYHNYNEVKGEDEKEEKIYKAEVPAVCRNMKEDSTKWPAAYDYLIVRVNHVPWLLERGYSVWHNVSMIESRVIPGFTIKKTPYLVIMKPHESQKYK